MRKIRHSLRRPLSRWKRNRQSVRAELRAMKFNWCDGEWQAWEELHKSPEMTDISNKALSRLEKAKARASNKGKGKGPE